MSNTQIITMKSGDIIKAENMFKTDNLVKTKRSKKVCFCCNKKLTLVDKSLDKCKGCNKRFCLSCLKPEIHTCTDKSRDSVIICKPIIPSKIDHI